MESSVFNKFADFIQNQYNLSFTKYNENQLKLAIQSRCQFLSISDPLHYLETIKQDKVEEVIFIDKIITGETCFFRYPDMYSLFIDHFQTQAHTLSRPIHILHIGCSTGEEPYTIAMLLVQSGYFFNTSTIINALDLNELAIQQAKQGLYLSKALRNTKPSFKQRFFDTPNNQVFELKANLRQKVNFYCMEIFQLPHSPLMMKYDFIFCMNVMIYFDSFTITKLIPLLKQMMHESTRLFLAPTDSIMQMNEQFEIHREIEGYWYGLRQETVPSVRFRHTQPSFQQPISLANNHLVCNAPVHSRKNEDDEQQSNPYLLGKQAYERKALEEAAQFFQLGIQQSCQILECHLGLAKIFADQGHSVQAAEMAEYVLANDESIDEAHLLLGILSLQVGHFEEARKRFHQSLHLNPTCLEAKNFLSLMNDA